MSIPWNTPINLHLIVPFVSENAVKRGFFPSQTNMKCIRLNDIPKNHRKGQNAYFFAYFVDFRIKTEKKICYFFT